MLLISAPSKTQQQVACQPPVTSIPCFLDEAAELNRLLATLTSQQLSSLMKTSENLTHATQEKIAAFSPSPTATNSAPAIFTFQGDAFAALTPEKYNDRQLLHAQNHIRILSGLYGILRPLDLMSPYRLEMGCRLENTAGKTLYDLWSGPVTETVNSDLASHRDKTLVNLASQEYSRVIRKKELQGDLLTITFKEKKDTGYKTIPIYSKRARSMMLHHVITNRLENSGDLRSFDEEGYCYNKELSGSNEWVFTR